MTAPRPSGEDRVSEIGRKLREAREACGLSLGEAASKADLSKEHLKEVEDGFPKPGGGRRLGPTLLKLERVANVYGLRVDLVPV